MSEHGGRPSTVQAAVPLALNGEVGVVMVPAELVMRWEVAYRRYGEVSTAAVVSGDPSVAREMATTSQAVAAAWRAMEVTTELPWWLAAALGAAAQAFEFQARDWSVQAETSWPVDSGQRTRSQVRPFPVRRLNTEG